MPTSLFLIAGPCAIEDKDMAMEIAEKVYTITQKLGIRYIFKGSYKKANRSKLDSFTGIDEQQALEILKEVGQRFDIPTITDIHESEDAARVSPYVDMLQIPAFLCRQTELLLAAGRTGKPVNIKKGQFSSPEAMRFAVEKIQSTGNQGAMLCERGTTFGYTDLIVDSTAIYRLRQLGVPVVMDCTHSVQQPNQTAGVTGGNPDLIESIALGAAANGADGFFMETHPEPAKAKSDPFTMLQLDKLEPILEKILSIRKALDYDPKN